MSPSLTTQHIEEIIDPSLQFLDSVGKVIEFALGTNDPQEIKAKAEELRELSVVVDGLITTNLERCQSLAILHSNQDDEFFDFRILVDELFRFAIWVWDVGCWRERMLEDAHNGINTERKMRDPSLGSLRIYDLRRMVLAEEARLRAFIRAEETNSQNVEQPQEYPRCESPETHFHLTQVFIDPKEGKSQPKANGANRKPKKRITEKSLADVILALLREHHNYGSDSFNSEPVVQKELAEKLNETQQGEKKDRTSTVSRFFREKFGGQKEYEQVCNNGDIQSRLAFLSGDVDRKQFVKELDEARVANGDDSN